MTEDDIGDLAGAHLLDIVAIENADAAIVGRMGADAELDRACGIDQALARRAADEGAVVDAAFLVGPGVLMRIELDEGEGAVDGGMGAAAAAA